MSETEKGGNIQRSGIGVIQREEKILMIRRHPYDRTYPDPTGKGKLVFPGGKCEKDELTKDTAVRETLEETGFMTRWLNYVKTGITTTSPSGRTFLIDVCFLKIESGELLNFPTDEIAEALWFTLEEALAHKDEFAGPVTLQTFELVYKWSQPDNLPLQTNWLWPLPQVYWDVPQDAFTHPGTFAARRKFDVHTGVDLYAPEDTPVYAVEDGNVVAIDRTFTGGPDTPIKDGRPIWLVTQAVLVSGASGVVLYGEIEPETFEIGQRVQRGDLIGRVKPVLHPKADGSPPKNPAGSRTMLHLDLYRPGSTAAVWWQLSDDQPINLRDPTQFLIEAEQSFRHST